MTRSDIARDAKAYEDNLFRLCGDWMTGTESRLPSADVLPGVEQLGSHSIEPIELSGHTDRNLVMIDRTQGVLFAGGLAFAQRIPTTPHAQTPRWLQSLDKLASLPLRALVASHSVVGAGSAGGVAAIAMTQRYLVWLNRALPR